MSKYCGCTLEEFRRLLRSEKGWAIETSGREVVFCYKLINGATIKVYSSVQSGSERGRGRGQDAIRVCVVDEQNNVGLEGSQKILRTPGWRMRLHNSVIERFFRWSGAVRHGNRLVRIEKTPPASSLMTAREDTERYGVYR